MSVFEGKDVSGLEVFDIVEIRGLCRYISWCR